MGDENVYHLLIKGIMWSNLKVFNINPYLVIFVGKVYIPEK